MRKAYLFGLATVLAIGATSPTVADPWKDESGHGRGDTYIIQPGYHAFQGPWGPPAPAVAPCRVERRWEPSGAYREEIDCYGHRPAYQQGWTVLPPAPAAPSLTIVIPID